MPPYATEPVVLDLKRVSRERRTKDQLNQPIRGDHQGPREALGVPPREVDGLALAEQRKLSRADSKVVAPIELVTS